MVAHMVAHSIGYCTSCRGEDGGDDHRESLRGEYGGKRGDRDVAHNVAWKNTHGKEDMQKETQMDT